MPDRGGSGTEKRQAPLHFRRIGKSVMACQRTDLQHVLLHPDAVQLDQIVEIDEMARTRQSHVQHRPEALSSGDRFRCGSMRAQ